MTSLRAAAPGDAAEVADVHVRSWQVGYRGLLPDDYLDALRPEDRAARYTFGAADPNLPATVVGIDDGVINGFITTGPCTDGNSLSVGEVLALYVDPERWGCGIGRRLIAEGRASLARRGFVEAVLWLLNGNARALRFYESDGWLPDGARRSIEVWGVLADEARLRRRLV